MLIPPRVPEKVAHKRMLDGFVKVARPPRQNAADLHISQRQGITHEKAQGKPGNDPLIPAQAESRLGRRLGARAENKAAAQETMTAAEAWSGRSSPTASTRSMPCRDAERSSVRCAVQGCRSAGTVHTRHEQGAAYRRSARRSRPASRRPMRSCPVPAFSIPPPHCSLPTR